MSGLRFSIVFLLAVGNANLALSQVVTPWSDASPPEGYADEPHDAFEDPFNPLKNPSSDPGDGSGPGGGAPNISQSSTDWDWGERYFSQQFDVTLTVTNGCNTAQPVSIFVNNLPYLTIADRVTVAGNSEKKVKGKVKLPDPPVIPPGQPLGLGLGLGWVEPPELGPQPLGTPPPVFHQPNFTPIEGSVVVWHAWGPDGDNAQCGPERTRYSVSGHIH